MHTAILDVSVPSLARDDLSAPALVDFHEGRRAAVERCYADHFATVDRAVARVLTGADRDTVVQEVFLRIIASADVRRSFRGGSMAAWISTLARNLAIDFVRKHRRERPLTSLETEDRGVDRREETDAKLLIDRFVRERLPAAWNAVFEARFLRQLSQRDAARELGMYRTTLAYQELRIRRLLKAFLTEDAA